MQCLIGTTNSNIADRGVSTPIKRPAVCLFGDGIMKEIPLTQGKVALVDDEDFELVSRFKWRAHSKGYAHTALYMGCIGGKEQTCDVYLHRLIMRPPKGFQVDHINHNKLDCRRRSNMRICTNTQNSQNRLSRKGTSKFKGVSWDRSGCKWRAQIRHDGTNIYLGLFDDELEAACTYDAKAKELFGEFAYVNFQAKEYERSQTTNA